mmetsp:Transcript_125719/g.350237  ORF Transcript_125719/g.350237 Transcript_125719/m.350237 type:complete len:516 (-) Transcript_125719:70-1617(-)
MGDYEYLEPLPQPRTIAQLSPQAEHFRRFKTKWSQQEASRIVRLAFSPSAPHRLAVVSGTKVSVWRGTKEGDAEVEANLSKFKDVTQCVAWRNDGKLLLAGEAGGSCALVEMDAKKVLRRFRGHGDAVTCASFASTDRSRCATGGRDGKLRTWDVATGELLQIIDAHSDCMKALTSGPGGADAWITSGHDGRVRLWDLRAADSGGAGGGACVVAMDHGHPVEDGVAFPGGTAYASAGGPAVKVWNLTAGGRPVQVLEEAHSKAVTAVCLDSLASVMLTASFDGLAKTFHAADMQHLWTYKLGAPATCAAWRPDDKAFVVGLDDGRWVLRQPLPSKAEQKAAQEPRKKLRREVTGSLRGQDATPAADDEIVEMPRIKKRRWYAGREVNYFLRKYEYRKAIEYMFLPKTLPTVGFAIIEELLQRGALDKALANLGEELCLYGLRWFHRVFATGDALQHRLFEEALHTLMDRNSCLNPPCTPQLVDAFKRLEFEMGKELRVMEVLMETSGMFKSIMTV